MYCEPSLEAPEGQDLVDENLRRAEPQALTDLIEVGTLVCGRYELLSYLGAGAVSGVFSARRKGIDDRVVLKFLQPEYLASSDAVRRFVRKARQASKLRGEHIVRHIDVDVHEHLPFLVVEALEGGTLRALLDQREQISLSTAVDFALQICEALAAAHAQGIVHRNIKPESLFVLGGERIKLSDFGLSKVALECDDDASQSSRSRQLANADRRGAGTDAPAYLSPEQIRDSSQSDARSDIWSLGCVLYELLSGERAFERSGLMQTCVAILEQEPRPLAAARTDVPEQLEAVLARCLRKDPAARWSDVAELATALVPFGSGRYSRYDERCRTLLNADSSRPSVVNVRPTVVLGPPAAAPALSMPALYRSSAGRMETLAFDPSALFAELEAERANEPASDLTVSGERPVQPQPENSQTVPAASTVEVAPDLTIEPSVVLTPEVTPQLTPVPERETALPPATISRPWAASVMLMAAVVCVLCAGVVWFAQAKPEKPAQPRLLHLVTPRLDEEEAEPTQQTVAAPPPSYPQPSPPPGSDPSQGVSVHKLRQRQH